MKTKNEKGYGVVTTTVTINVVDAIALAECNHIAGEEMHKAINDASYALNKCPKAFDCLENYCNFINKFIQELLPTDRISLVFASEKEWQEHQQQASL